MFKLLLGCYSINNKNSMPIAYKIIRKYCTIEKNIGKSYITDRYRNQKIFEGGISKQKQLIWCQQRRSLDINTDVKNNVFLYKYENLDKSHRKFLTFAVVQLFFWAALNYGLYCLYYDYIPNDLSWIDICKKYGLQAFLLLFTIAAGPLILICACALITRSVKYVILNKGGKEATIVTYHPFKKERHLKVPVKMVSTRSSRNDPSNHVGLKVQGHFMNFILEKKGKFVNPDLFDCTVGQLKRSW